MKLDKELDRCPKELDKLDFICGVDEVGRGCGAGDVFASAVILPKGFSNPLLRDSKKLSEKQRNEAYIIIKENALHISTSIVSVDKINELGIDGAIKLSITTSINNLLIKPDHILIDGLPFENTLDKSITFVVKGDDTYSSIAAAAIIAKVERDKHMGSINDVDKSFMFEKNKGYLTADHIKALKELGPTKYHREKFIRNFI